MTTMTKMMIREHQRMTLLTLSSRRMGQGLRSNRRRSRLEMKSSGKKEAECTEWYVSPNSNADYRSLVITWHKDMMGSQP
jgi:hypothetical protein